MNKHLARRAENLDSVRCPHTGVQLRFMWDEATPDEVLHARYEALHPRPNRRRRRRERSRP